MPDLELRRTTVITPANGAPGALDAGDTLPAARDAVAWLVCAVGSGWVGLAAGSVLMAIVAGPGGQGPKLNAGSPATRYQLVMAISMDGGCTLIYITNVSLQRS